MTKSLIDSLDIPNAGFINGADYTTTDTFAIISPIDTAQITTLPAMSASDIDTAVMYAQQAYEDGTWRNMPKGDKKAVLLKFADLINENAEYLGQLESLDMGMPVNMCIGMNIGMCANAIRWYAEAIDKIYDETISHDGSLNLITREPVGVVGVITPWNFPSMIVGWKIAPALMMGNSVVLKPAETASLATIAIAKLGGQAGLPKGVFNVVTGFGSVAGEALCKHNAVRVLAFTGSGATGAKILQYSGQSNMKRVYLELGGKNANIIFPDAPDFETAIGASVMSIFANSGQICASPSRLFVHRDIIDDFTQNCINLAKTLSVGNPFEDKNFLGPLANEQQYNKVLKYIEIGKSEGAKCVLGGDTPDMDGYYVNPTIFADVTPDMTIYKEEIFGPVLCIVPFDDRDEVIKMANDTEYGLTAAVWSGDINNAHYVASRLEAGTVHVNKFGTPDITTPFGGVKQSGNGSDQSLHAIEKYTNIKTTSIALT